MTTTTTAPETGAEEALGWLGGDAARLTALAKRCARIVDKLAPIGDELRTQDNLGTSDPVFIVQQKRRIYGGDEGYGDHVWVNDGCEADEEDHKRFDELDRNFDEIPEGWSRLDYVDVFDFVRACFTRKAAERYLEENRHNLTEPRIWTDTAYRNREWIELRALFVECSQIVEEERGRPL